jgi:formylglycine-generating enzyme required for sulfatase activity
MPDDGPIARDRRQYKEDAWYRRIGAALEGFLFPFDMERRRARMERKMALLVPPPMPERFPHRLADLGFVRHGTAVSGQGWYITPPLCHVGAGSFLMGSDPREDADTEDDELPQHTIETESYWIGTYPVTVAEYDCAVRDGAVREPRYGLNSWTYQLQGLDDPVNCISWADATAYAAWLARLTGQAWRLPTEAEWEKAARGTDGRIYPWGKPVGRLARQRRHGRWADGGRRLCRAGRRESLRRARSGGQHLGVDEQPVSTVPLRCG